MAIQTRDQNKEYGPVTVEILRDTVGGGQRLAKGQVVEIPHKDAAYLIASKKAVEAAKPAPAKKKAAKKADAKPAE